MPETKQCTRCGERKELDEFNRDSAAIDGRRTTCRECDRKRTRQYRAENREAINKRRREHNRQQQADKLKIAAGGKVTEPKKQCTRCGKKKPLREYRKLKTARDGYNGVCKTCRLQKRDTAHLRTEKPDYEPEEWQCVYSGCDRHKNHDNDPYHYGFCDMHAKHAERILGFKLTA